MEEQAALEQVEVEAALGEVEAEAADRAADEEAVFRRRLVSVAAVATVLAIVHHADHVVRGELVFSRYLEPSWSHSGWPFQPEVTPFTASLLIEPLLLAGIWHTLRGRLWAGFWLGAAVLLGAVVASEHLLPGPKAETPAVIFNTYPSPVVGGIAVGVLVALMVTLVAMAATAVLARRAQGRW